MKQEEMITTVKKMVSADSCCPEAKAAGEAYLKAVGTNNEKSAVKALINELEEDVNSIDDFLTLTESEEGKQMFGEKQAAAMHEAALKAKKAGGKYCLCDACQAGGALLDEIN